MLLVGWIILITSLSVNGVEWDFSVSAYEDSMVLVGWLVDDDVWSQERGSFQLQRDQGSAGTLVYRFRPNSNSVYMCEFCSIRLNLKYQIEEAETTATTTGLMVAGHGSQTRPAMISQMER